jgi:hypothetical protein
LSFALTIKVLKSKKLKLVAGKLSNGFFAAFGSSSTTSFFSAFFGASFFGSAFFFGSSFFLSVDYNPCNAYAANTGAP